MKMNIMNQESFQRKISQNRFLFIFILSVFLLYLCSWFYSIHLSKILISDPFFSPPVMGSDSLEYKTLADSIITKGYFSLDGINPETFRVPGYPLFIALLFGLTGSYFTVTFFQILIVFATAYLIFKIGQLVYSELVGKIGASLFLLDPTTIFHSLVILSDNLYVFILVLACYLFIKNRYEQSLVAVCTWSLLLGVSVLIRPISVFILPVFLVFLFFLNSGFKNSLFKKIIVAVICFCIPVIPLIVRNYMQDGVSAVSSLSGFNLAYYNLPMFFEDTKGIPKEETRRLLGVEEGTVSFMNAKRLVHSSELGNKVKPLLIDNISSYIPWHIRETAPFVFASSIKTFFASLNQAGVTNFVASKTLVFIERLFWALVFTSPFVAFYGDKNRLLTLLFICLIAYFALLTGPVAYVRYRMPVEPFVFLTVPVAYMYFRDNLRKVYSMLKSRQ